MKFEPEICNKYAKLQHSEQTAQATHMKMFKFLRMSYFSDKHFEKEVREEEEGMKEYLFSGRSRFLEHC